MKRSGAAVLLAIPAALILMRMLNAGESEAQRLPSEEHPGTGGLPDGWERYHGARPEPQGFPGGSILAVPGLSTVDASARATLLAVSADLGVPADSLATVISSESRWRADAKNPGGAYGLIQLSKSANLKGFTTQAQLERILKMSAADQLTEVVLPYYRRVAAKGSTPGRLYMLNFLPGFADKPPEFVLARSGETIYAQNRNLFDQSGKGFFTVDDVHAAAARICAMAARKRLSVSGAEVESV